MKGRDLPKRGVLTLSHGPMLKMMKKQLLCTMFPIQQTLFCLSILHGKATAVSHKLLMMDLLQRFLIFQTLTVANMVSITMEVYLARRHMDYTTSLLLDSYHRWKEEPPLP